MAVYGQGQMLGDGFDPRMLIQDYSGIAEAARIQAQALSGLGATIGGAIKSFGEAKKENQEMEGKVKAAIQSIDSLSKLVPGFDAEAAKSSLLDPDTPLRVRSTLGEEAVNNITNMVNFGMQFQQAALQQRQMGLRERELQRLEMQPIEVPVAGGTQMMQMGPGGVLSPIKTTDLDVLGQPPSSAVPMDGVAAAITELTRDQIKLQPGQIGVSHDFNDADNPNAKGVEVIIPDNATPEVRAAAEKYAADTANWFRSKGYADYPNRGVKTRSENKRGVPGRVHVEPFFAKDAKAVEIMNQNQAEYAGILAGSFGQLSNAVIHAPHNQKDPGASLPSGMGEREFFQRTVLPAARQVFARPGFTPAPTQPKQERTFVPQEQIDAIISQGGTIKGTPYSDTAAGISGMLVDPGGVTIGGQKTSNVPKFRPASPQEAAQYGETAGQIDETTGRFYPPRAKTGEQVSITTDREGKTTVTTTPVAVSGDKAARDAEKEKAREQSVVASATATTQDLFEIKRKYEGIKPTRGVIPSVSRIVAGEIPGTETQELKSLIDRVTSGMTLDKLQSIRQNSPTGGALGNVSNKDTALLQNSVSNLKAAQNPQEFNREWTRLTETYLDIAYGRKDQRDQLVKDGKITSQQNAEIESLYPSETIGPKGEMIQRQRPESRTLLNPYVQGILNRALGR